MVGEAAQMAARVPVHRDESVDVCVHGLLREALLGSVVIDHRRHGGGLSTIQRGCRAKSKIGRLLRGDIHRCSIQRL